MTWLTAEEIAELLVAYDRRSDDVYFEAEVQAAPFVYGWGWPTVKAVFTSMAERLLHQNEALVFLLARAALQQKRLSYGDCVGILGYGQRQHGLMPSPLLHQDWRTWLERELACQRRVERLLAEEVARNQALAAEHVARAASPR
jgi:hypothetical protein